MREKEVVLVDMDDTICDLVGTCIDHHNVRWPDHPIAYDKVESWEMEKLWHPECTLEAFFGVPGLYAELPLVDEYVVDEMRQIHEDYELIIVTAAWPDSVVDKWAWIQKHLPFIPYDNFCTWKKKYHIDGDLLIDDAIHNLVPFSQSGRPVIGIPRPWNETIRKDIMFRHSWKGMKSLVDDILSERRKEREILSSLSQGKRRA